MSLCLARVLHNAIQVSCNYNEFNEIMDSHRSNIARIIPSIEKDELGSDPDTYSMLMVMKDGSALLRGHGIYSILENEDYVANHLMVKVSPSLIEFPGIEIIRQKLIKWVESQQSMAEKARILLGLEVAKICNDAKNADIEAAVKSLTDPDKAPIINDLIDVIVEGTSCLMLFKDQTSLLMSHIGAKTFVDPTELAKFMSDESQDEENEKWCPNYKLLRIELGNRMVQSIEEMMVDMLKNRQIM